MYGTTIKTALIGNWSLMREIKQTGYGGAIPLPLGQLTPSFPSGNNAGTAEEKRQWHKEEDQRR